MPGIIKKNAYSAVTAGSATIGAVAYNGTTQAAGQFDSGAVDPVHTNVLNYDGTFAATGLKLTPGGVGMQFGVVANGTVTALGPAASALSAYNYVVAISAAGGTMLNTLTGTSLTIGVANSAVVTISATGASVTGTLSRTGLDLSTSKSVVSTASLTAATVSVARTYFTGAAGTSFAITLPAASAAIDGQIMVVMSTAARVTTTWISSGATFVGAPSALVANTPVKLQYDNATTAWYITQ